MAGKARAISKGSLTWRRVSELHAELRQRLAASKSPKAKKGKVKKEKKSEKTEKPKKRKKEQ